MVGITGCELDPELREWAFSLREERSSQGGGNDQAVNAGEPSHF